MTDTIESFFAEWPRAEQAGDTARLDRLLTDDFVGTGPLGFTLPRQAWLARFGQGLRYDEFSVEDLQPREHGDTAVVLGRHRQTGSFGGAPIPQVLQATHVLTRDGAGWRLAAVHMSFVAGTPGAPPLPAGAGGREPVDGA